MKKALLIGIDKYPGDAALHGCVSDARVVAALLERNQDGVLNMETEVRADVPDRSSLLRLITDLFSARRSLSLLYFSGHGYKSPRGGFLVTPDAEEFDEGISMDQIVQIANVSPAHDKIIILDCCHAGAIADGNPAAGMNIQIMEGLTILSASRNNEPAMMHSGKSVFTDLLAQALSGGAADIRGRISPASIYTYIDQALGETGQRPVFKTHITRFITLRETSPKLPHAILRQLTTHFSTPDEEHPLDPSHEDTNTPDWQPRCQEPCANPEKVRIFKELQQMQAAGLVVPHNAPYMYFAAMDSQSCKLTPLGQHYWRLVKAGRI